MISFYIYKRNQNRQRKNKIKNNILNFEYSDTDIFERCMPHFFEGI